MEKSRNNKPHSEYFRAVSNYIKKIYGVEPDKSGKDIAGVCFLPYDPALL